MKKFYAILALVCIALTANAQKLAGLKLSPVKKEMTKSQRSTVNSQRAKAASGLEYDEEDADFKGEFTGSIDADYLDYGMAYLEAESESEYVCLEFNIDTTDPDIVIPAGTYPIDLTWDAGTVSASEGIDWEWGYVTGSYASTLDDEGYLDKFWYLVDGTVTVSKVDGQLKAVVNGVNSYGKKVNVTITAKAEATPTGENKLTNGGFEEWTDESTPTGWTGWQITEQGNTGGATLAQSPEAHDGEFACLVKGASSNKRLSTEKLTLDAGTYYVTFYAKAATEGAAVKFGYATQQANGSALYAYDKDADGQDSRVDLGDDWQKVSYSFKLSEKSDAAIVIMNVKNTGDCYIDDVTLVKDGNGDDDDDEPLEYDEDSNFAYDFNASSIDEDYLEDYGVLYLEAEDGDKYVCLEFNVDSTDPAIVIPAGTYPINYSYEAGTVSASEGVDDEGYIYGSFASTLDDEGYLDKVWFLVDGTVTVSKVDGKLFAVVEGVNSYGKKISVTIGAGDAPIDPDNVEVYSIDFTKGNDGWTIDDKNLSEGMTFVWKQDNTYGMKASAYVNKTNMPAESWIISPEIDLTTIGNAVLSFSHAVNFCAAPANTLKVLVSENGTDWTELEIDNWPTGKDWNFVNATASLANYAEKKIQIAFKYTSTDSEAATWEIKNLSVTGQSIYTGIDKVEINGQQSTDAIFNLAGQKVGADYKGVVIVNGKKYLKK